MKQALLHEQRNEITSHIIYQRLSKTARGAGNRETLGRISDNELEHYETLKSLTHTDVPPRRLYAFFFLSSPGASGSRSA